MGIGVLAQKNKGGQTKICHTFIEIGRHYSIIYGFILIDEQKVNKNK